MQEVELRLIAPNSEAIKSIRELASESKKLYDLYDSRQRGQKAAVDAEIKSQKTLGEQRKSALNKKELEEYNKLLEESKRQLQQIDDAQADVNRENQNFVKSLKGWTAGLASVGMALNLLKDAFKATEAGLRTFNAVGSVTKQILYDIVAGNKINIASIAMSIRANKELEAVRVKQRNDLVDIAKAQRLFNELYFTSSDQTKTGTQRLQAMNQAMLAHEVLVEKRIENAKQELHAIELSIAARPKETALLDAHAAKLAEIETLEGERYSEIKRLESQRTGIIQQMSDKEVATLKEAMEEKLRIQEAFYQLSEKLLQEYDKSQIDSLTGNEKLIAQRNFALKQLDIFRGQMKALGTLSDEQKAMFEKLGENVRKSFEKGLNENNPGSVDSKGLFGRFFKDLTKSGELQDSSTDQKGERETFWDLIGIDPDGEEGKSLKEGVSAISDALDEIYDKRVADAQRNRELAQSRLSEAQQELETEIELYKAGYASNVEGKKKEIEQLKKERDKAISEENKAAKAQRLMDTMTQSSSLITASSNIFKSLSKLGPIGVIGAIATIATMFAAFAKVKSDAAKVTKLGHGGHGMVNGRLHSEGGEPFLNHIEVEQGERWGVLSRSASRKYGKAFGEIVDGFNRDKISFNKLPIPKAGINVNNINLNNDGPNTRLDRLIKLQKETVTVDGNRTIIKKGDSIRIIKR